LPTGHGKSLIYQLQQKNLGCGCFRTKNFTSGLRAYFYGEMAKWRNDIYFGQRRDKQTARETITCRLAAGNFEDETVSVENIIFTA